MKKSKSETGFTLIEVMIAIALVSGLGLAVVKIIEQAQKGQKGVQNNIDFDNLRNSVTLLVRNQTLCSTGLMNLNGTKMATFSPAAAVSVSPQDSLGSLHLGGSILAQKDKQIGGGLVISKIDLINTTVSPVVTPGRKTYIAKLIIEATRNKSVGSKIISNKKNPIFLSVTVNSATNKIVTCGGSDPMVLEYPSSCKITLGHSDNNKPFRDITLQLNGPGHVGLLLSGDVNGDDRLSIKGSCNPNAGPLDKYLSTCLLGIGTRDLTKSKNETVNQFPDGSVFNSMTSTAASQLKFKGDVDGNDSFYFQMQCPTSADPALQEAQDYIRSKCFLCFGYSDNYGPQMDTRVCSPVQNFSTFKWSRFRFTGDVNGDDILYPGFYCSNDAGATVWGIRWN